MKRLFSVFLLIVCGIFFSLLVPHKASAAILPYFGGSDIVDIPCTCTSGYEWHFFFPLYYSLSGAGPTVGPTAGALVAPITPTTYSNYYLRESTWALGSYTPGAGSICEMGAEPYCYTIQSIGLVLPATGVSALSTE